MVQENITCPNCGLTIPLSEAFTKPLEVNLRKEFEMKGSELSELEQRQLNGFISRVSEVRILHSLML